MKEQRYANEPSFGKSDIFIHAMRFRLSSEQLLLNYEQKKICPFGGDAIQLHCPPPLALASNLNKVYGWNISICDDQTDVAYEKDCIGSHSGRQILTQEKEERPHYE